MIIVIGMVVEVVTVEIPSIIKDEPILNTMLVASTSLAVSKEHNKY